MLNLQRTAMFIAVADTGSFTAAAEAMGLTKAVVSFHIRQLEEELGCYGMQGDCRMTFAPTTPG